MVMRSIDGVVVLTTTADAQGNATVGGLAPGTYLIELTDANGKTSVQSVEVLGAVLSAPGALALTGSQPAPFVGTAVLLILSGLALLIGRRRRPVSTESN